MLNREDISINEYLEAESRNYLVVIGIDKYENGIPKLKNAVLDAQQIQKCLIDNYQFEKKYCYEFYNSDATRKNIFNLFDDLEDQITDQDNIVIYYSGHGKYLFKADKGYLLLADAEKDTRSTYLPKNELKDFIKKINPLHAFLILDSCFSGSIFRSDENIPISRLYKRPSRYLLTSGRYDEPVLDGVNGRHSPFCSSLLSILNKNKSPKIWVGDLCRMVLKSVTEKTKGQNPRGEASIELGHEGGEFAFILKSIGTQNLCKFKSNQGRELIYPEAKWGSISNQQKINRKLKLSKVKILQLKQWIGKGETQKVVDLLINRIHHYDSNISDEIILLENQWEELQRDIRLGVISTDEKLLITRKFTLSLLGLVDKLKKETISQ